MEEIESLDSLEPADIFALIPLYLADSRQETTIFSPYGQERAGREWFESVVKALRGFVCESWRGCEKIESSAFNDSKDLAAALFDAMLIAGLNLGVPVTVISVLLAKLGVRQLCRCGEAGL
ncbi:MAG TPA: hypothetical protein VFC19_06520 [Candidatus Limnocylindrales bacterium]|nr:hypothetical protein [Candidatus Limnocylindrales bacterium]